MKNVNENLSRMENNNESPDVQKVINAMIGGMVGIMAFQVISDLLNNDEEHEKRRTGFGKIKKRKKTNNNMERIL